ncbi:MAG: hypothetical protein WB696_21930 [Chthoniobacterales bacterium]
MMCRLIANLGVRIPNFYDSVNLTEIKEEDLPKEKLQQALLRHDGAVYLIKNE